MPRIKKTTSSKKEPVKSEKHLKKFNQEGKEVGEIVIKSTLFEEANDDLLMQAARVYSQNQRKGLVSSKTRAEVSGGGKKPWKEKGTGRARQGSIRAPHWRGGGAVFGPKPRDYSLKMNQKMKKISLKVALGEKYNKNNLIVLTETSDSFNKTNQADKLFKSLNLIKKNCSLLVVLDKANLGLVRVMRNLPYLKMVLADSVNALEVMKASQVILTESGLKKLEERL